MCECQDMTSAGMYLREARVRLGSSLRDACTALGVSHTTLGEIERGLRKHIDCKFLARCEANLPGFSADEFVRIAKAGSVSETPSLAERVSKIEDLVTTDKTFAERLTNLEFTVLGIAEAVRKLESAIGNDDDDDIDRLIREANEAHQTQSQKTFWCRKTTRRVKRLFLTVDVTELIPKPVVVFRYLDTGDVFVQSMESFEKDFEEVP